MTEEEIRVKAEGWLSESKKLFLVTEKNVEQVKKTISEIGEASGKVANKRTIGYLACANNFFSKALKSYDDLLQAKAKSEEDLKAKIKENTEKMEKTKKALAERLARAKASKIKEEVEKEIMKEEVKEKVEEIKKKRGRPPKEKE